MTQRGICWRCGDWRPLVGRGLCASCLNWWGRYLLGSPHASRLNRAWRKHRRVLAAMADRVEEAAAAGCRRVRPDGVCFTHGAVFPSNEESCFAGLRARALGEDDPFKKFDPFKSREAVDIEENAGQESRL